jgi:hypothetical protein
MTVLTLFLKNRRNVSGEGGRAIGKACAHGAPRKGEADKRRHRNANSHCHGTHLSIGTRPETDSLTVAAL